MILIPIPYLTNALSKNDLDRFREMIPNAELIPRPVPRTVMAWLEAPTVDPDLGRKIVRELEILGVQIYDSMRL